MGRPPKLTEAEERRLYYMHVTGTPVGTCAGFFRVSRATANRIRGTSLISPEGWKITENEVCAVLLLRLQIEAYQSELRQIRAAESLDEQPSPAAWPEWIERVS